LFDYYEKLEYGIDTPCGTNGSRLSLGMQKIIMVIRGILKPNKSIVIYDEPLTSLDQETRKKIVKLIVNETKVKQSLSLHMTQISYHMLTISFVCKPFFKFIFLNSPSTSSCVIIMMVLPRPICLMA